MKVNKLEERFVKMSVGTIDIYTFPMTVNDLAKISYVAVRGRDKEEGAVQRVLNKKRISSINYCINAIINGGAKIKYVELLAKSILGRKLISKIK